MLASAATASARAGPDRTAALTGYDSSLPGQQLGVDRRDLREQLLDLLAVAQVPAHHPGQGRRDVPQPAPGRPVFGAKKAYGPCGSPPAHRQPGLAAPPRLLGQRAGQHLLGAAEPRGQGAPPRQQPPRRHARQAGPDLVLLLFHHKRVCRCQA